MPYTAARLERQYVGGDIRVGACGSLQCTSGAGRIEIGIVQGMARMETVGGDITVAEVGAPVMLTSGAQLEGPVGDLTFRIR